MEPLDAVRDWQDRMALLIAEAVGYEVRTLDGERVGTIEDVGWPDGGSRPAQIAIGRGGFWGRTRQVSSELVRAVDPARRTVVLALGSAAVHEGASAVHATPDAAAEGESPRAYLLFVPTPGGYAIAVREGVPDALGARVDLDDRSYHVSKLGRSPLPGDDRLCVYLI